MHPDLLVVPNVVLTPHIASATLPTRLAMTQLAADNLMGFLLHGKALTPLNPEVLSWASPSGEASSGQGDDLTPGLAAS